jgi:hypothetical protein
MLKHDGEFLVSQPEKIPDSRRDPRRQSQEARRFAQRFMKGRSLHNDRRITPLIVREVDDATSGP